MLKKCSATVVLMVVLIFLNNCAGKKPSGDGGGGDKDPQPKRPQVGAGRAIQDGKNDLPPAGADVLGENRGEGSGLADQSDITRQNNFGRDGFQRGLFPDQRSLGGSSFGPQGSLGDSSLGEGDAPPIIDTTAPPPGGLLRSLNEPNPSRSQTIPDNGVFQRGSQNPQPIRSPTSHTR